MMREELEPPSTQDLSTFQNKQAMSEGKSGDQEQGESLICNMLHHMVSMRAIGYDLILSHCRFDMRDLMKAWTRTCCCF